MLLSTQSGSVNSGQCITGDSSGQCIAGDDGSVLGNALLVIMVLGNALLVMMVLGNALLVMMVLFWAMHYL